MAVNLIFTRARHAGGPVHLVFGDAGAPPAQATAVTGTSVLGSVSGSGSVATSPAQVTSSTVTGTSVLGGVSSSGAVHIVPRPVAVAGASVLGGVGGYGVALYDNRNPPRVSTNAALPHQLAARRLLGTGTGWAVSRRELGQHTAPWQPAAPLAAEPAAPWAPSAQAAAQRAAAWELARAVIAQAASAHQVARPLRAQSSAPWQAAQGAQARLAQSDAVHQAARSLLAQAVAPWGVAARLQALAFAPYGSGTARAVQFLARWQTARPVPAGREVWPKPTPEITPRVPSTHLLFACPPAWLGSGPVHLLFGRVCGGPEYPTGTIVVPIRSVYMTINNFSLIRLDNGFPIPATGMSLSLDADSWTWNCSFSVRGDVLPFVEPNSSGDPVIAQATVNGTPIRFIIEKIGRERTFGVSQLRCSGRGISAALDAPYAPVQSFNNDTARTVRQLLDDILTLNGQSIGWAVDRFDPTDWLVPASVFSHTGTYISAINAVVGAAGAYVQPKNTTDALDVLLRYPTPAWEWSSAVPDLILPSAVTSREGIEWVDKPTYDRVFVSGQQGGVSGRYTRTGTAGEMLAPAVVDPLITHADAVRQRGRAVISDTGRIANVTLRLPVLSETGIIRPGTMVGYADGPVERKGLTRSLALDVSMPTIYQTIEVETHVE